MCVMPTWPTRCSWMLETGEGLHLGQPNNARYWFMVPAGTQEFRIHVEGVHRGAYGAAVLAADGCLMAFHKDANSGPVRLQNSDGDGEDERYSATGTIVIRPEREQTEKCWSVILFGTRDVKIRLDGVPTVLAPSPGQWYDPSEE